MFEGSFYLFNFVDFHLVLRDIYFINIRSENWVDCKVNKVRQVGQKETVERSGWCNGKRKAGAGVLCSLEVAWVEEVTKVAVDVVCT